MTTVSIICPVSWWEQTEWIRNNCSEYQDLTNWAAWQIGLDDIYFNLCDEDAIMFVLKWG